MNAYAPNDNCAESAFAPLTSSLLARKGEALPAVDAVAHEGVDIDMHPSQQASGGGARQARARAGQDIYHDGAHPEAPGARPANVRLVHSSAERATADEAPDAWTLPGRRPAGARPSPLRRGARAAVGLLARKAVVTLRMPARELVRLKLAARDLEMSCQAIILDALECYLDANDVPSASDDAAIQREIERLMNRAKAKRRG